MMGVPPFRGPSEGSRSSHRSGEPEGHPSGNFSIRRRPERQEKRRSPDEDELKKFEKILNRYKHDLAKDEASTSDDKIEEELRKLEEIFEEARKAAERDALKEAAEKDKGKGPKEPDKNKKDLLAAFTEQLAKLESKLAEGQGIAGAREISAAQAKGEMSKLAALIQKMVDKLYAGQVGGKSFAALELTKGPEVPTFLNNTHLTITQIEPSKISISFSNFTSPQQQANAILAIEKGKAELDALLANLQAKNIAVTEFMIGTHVVALPRVEPLPPPFAPAPAAEAYRERGEREGRGDQRGQDEEGRHPKR